MLSVQDIPVRQSHHVLFRPDTAAKLPAKFPVNHLV